MIALLMAAVFSPPSTPMTIVGSITTDVIHNCPFQLNAATTSSGYLMVFSGKFCSQVTPTRFPWTWNAHSTRLQTARAPMSFTINGLDCAYDNPRIQGYTTGWLIYPGQGVCHVQEGTFQTSVKLSITK